MLINKLSFVKNKVSVIAWNPWNTMIQLIILTMVNTFNKIHLFLFIFFFFLINLLLRFHIGVFTILTLTYYYF